MGVNICNQKVKQPKVQNQIIINEEIPIIKGNFDFTQSSTFRQIQFKASKFCQQRFISQQHRLLVRNLIAYRHDNLFQAYQYLQSQQRDSFLNDLLNLDIQFMDSLYHKLIKLNKKWVCSTPTLAPYQSVVSKSSSQIQKYLNCGINMIKQQRVGIVIMCGGSSSKFGQEDKFLYPLQIPSKKCILQLMFQRLAKNVKTGRSILQIPIIIACSNRNYFLIKQFLQIKRFFGFNSNKIKVIITKRLPILDSNGKFCLSFQHKVIDQPAGTAQSVQIILSQTVLRFLKQNGVRYVHFVGSENLIENPADPLLLGLLKNSSSNCCAKCVLPLNDTQNFNRYVLYNNRVYLINASQLSSFNKSKLFEASPIAMNSIVIDFDYLQQIKLNQSNKRFLAQKYHLLEGQFDTFDFSQQKSVRNKKCYKFQKDLLDILTCCYKPQLILYPRSHFIPLITKLGFHSLKDSSMKYLQTIQETQLQRFIGK